MLVASLLRPAAQAWLPAALFASVLGASAAALAAQPGAGTPGSATARPAAKAAEDGEWALEVVPGDTLTAIAERLLRQPHTWQSLHRHNALRDPHFILPGNTLRIPLSWLRSEAAQAEVIQVSGSVAYSAPGAPADAAAPPAVGQRLEAGSRLRTGDNASVTLRFDDGSQALVTPGSRLLLLQMQRMPGAGAVRGTVQGGVPATGPTQTQLQLDAGSVESQVAPQRGQRNYQIRTPVITLGVRGTHFRATVDEGAAGAGEQRLEVLSGGVQAQTSRAPEAAARTAPDTAPAAAAASAGGSADVSAGQGIVASASGRLGAVETLLPAPALQPPTGPLQMGQVLQWPDLAGASAYRVQLLSAGTPPLALLRDLRSSQPRVAWADVPPGAYRMRVRGVAVSGLEGQDAETTLLLQAAPPPPPPTLPPPTPALPLEGQRLRAEAVLLSWYSPAPGQRHRLQVSRDAAFADLVIERSPEPADTTLQQWLLHLPPGTYHWRLATLDAEGRPGPYGQPRSFELRSAQP